MLSSRKALLFMCLVIKVTSSKVKNDCSVLKEDGVKHFDLKLADNLTLPQQQTFYVCQQFKIPEELLDETHHVVAFSPLIDNKEVMHHMILFACNKGTDELEPHSCGRREQPCRSFLTVWSLGFESSTCLYPKAGISIGKGGHQTLSLQIHWNNAKRGTNLTDASGIRIHYTKKCRKYELGNVQIGQNDIEIPTGSVNLENSGSCSPNCTSKPFTSAFYLTRTFIHMHSLGTAGRLDHYRNGKHIRNIAYDLNYSYQRPPVHYHPRAIPIQPGDEIKLTCWFTTVGGERERNETIYWGEGVEGEMCYAFVSYFPKAAGFDQCVQYADYDQCDNYNKQILIMGDCNFNWFLREMSGEIGTVRQSCDEKTIAECESRCAHSIRRIYKHPCLQGRLAVLLQRQVATTVNWDKLDTLHEKYKSRCRTPM